jgi:hypothetical protein
MWKSDEKRREERRRVERRGDVLLGWQLGRS